MCSVLGSLQGCYILGSQYTLTRFTCMPSLMLQAGARKVYAVEASGMAKFAQQLADKNPGFGKAVQVRQQTAPLT